jgi:Domain of unknown function (DUF4276)
MSAVHLEVLVEEPSMEAFLGALLPRLLPADRTFMVHPFQGKDDLLGRLQDRLRGYATWLPDDWRIVVVVDRDDDDCVALKAQLELLAKRAKLRTRTSRAKQPWQLVNRIAIEELEAWYFGDWAGVRAAYPRLPQHVAGQAPYRHPDAVAGGTWEAFERVLQRYGYFRGGLSKIEAARAIGAAIEPQRSRSPSFVQFRDVVIEAVA